MKTFQGYSPIKTAKTPTAQSYMGYLTQKQLQQLYKNKKDQESDKESYISGHSKGRRAKLRHVVKIFMIDKKKLKGCGRYEEIENFSVIKVSIFKTIKFLKLNELIQ